MSSGVDKTVQSQPRSRTTAPRQERPDGRAIGRAVRTKQANAYRSAIAPQILDIQASGATTLRQIAAELNARGVRTVRGGPWSATQVKRILDWSQATQRP